jgi:hypothetical protein
LTATLTLKLILAVMLDLSFSPAPIRIMASSLLILLQFLLQHLPIQNNQWSSQVQYLNFLNHRLLLLSQNPNSLAQATTHSAPHSRTSLLYVHGTSEA